jgi:cytochrome oxidase Cu insertion factor (SCO1/SenC/PrrC family)
MIRHALIATNLVLFSAAAPIVRPLQAQRGGGSRPSGQIVPPGTMLPGVTAYDEQGEKFSTASLRGSYTVLVFGCLT